MICPKCETQNKDGSAFCKICGESLLVKATASPADEERADAVNKIDSSVSADSAPKSSKDASPEKKEDATCPDREELRTKTSPLAVRMQEKIDRADKKVIKKLKRGRTWATLAIIMTVLFLAENAFIVSYELGYLEKYFSSEENVEEEVPPEAPTEPVIPEKTGTDRYYGEWSYTYSLTKYHDDDLSGSYAKKTEEITSGGKAVLTDTGNSHLAVTVIPEGMTVDGASVEIGATPEAFYGWLDGENIAVQMKGTEQKFFAPGGNEPLVINLAVTEGEALTGAFETTYDKTVGEMNMRYVFSVSFTKAAE